MVNDSPSLQALHLRLMPQSLFFLGFHSNELVEEQFLDHLSCGHHPRLLGPGSHPVLCLQVAA